jgi:hypothetical protein
MGDRELRSYSVWRDYQEQWDLEDVPDPDYQCRAIDHAAAASDYAEDCEASSGEFIVRDDESGTFRQVELVRSWEVRRDVPTSLAELSEP